MQSHMRQFLRLFSFSETVEEENASRGTATAVTPPPTDRSGAIGTWLPEEYLSNKKSPNVVFTECTHQWWAAVIENLSVKAMQ